MSETVTKETLVSTMLQVWQERVSSDLATRDFANDQMREMLAYTGFDLKDDTHRHAGMALIMALYLSESHYFRMGFPASQIMSWVLAYMRSIGGLLASEESTLVWDDDETVD